MADLQGKAFNDKFAISKNWLPASTDQPDLSAHVYSRQTTEVRSRLESILGHLEQGSMAYAVTYGSGLSAIFAVFQLIQPKRILTSTGGYNGTHGIIEMYMRGRTLYIENDKDGSLLKSLEADLHYYTTNRKPGVIVGIDSTFAPPPLQCPLKHTFKDRVRLGSNMGSMEAWLLLRSMRSYKLRILQQSSSATTLVKWLNSRISGESNDETWISSKKYGMPPSPPILVMKLHYVKEVDSLAFLVSSIGLEDVEDLQKDLSAGMLQVKKLVEDMDEKSPVQVKLISYCVCVDRITIKLL
ncbi:hypothetical protein BSLG_006067 [Batrachochytrium salamandrivorans]|nr:hypothetical protein BSLG_006067 [Batrachochytrium salamandrivorans]